jgi:hypothetical protein
VHARRAALPILTDDERAGAVDEDLLRDAAERAERTRQTFAPVIPSAGSAMRERRSAASIPELDARYLHNVSQSGPDDIWLLDYYEIPNARCRASHWDGTSWTSHWVPFAACEGVATAGHHFVWVVGDGNQLIHMQH